MCILYPFLTSSALHPPDRHFVLEQIHAEIPDAMTTGPVFKQAVQIALHCRHLQWPLNFLCHTNARKNATFGSHVRQYRL